jgi:hypothetical protein
MTLARSAEGAHARRCTRSTLPSTTPRAGCASCVGTPPGAVRATSASRKHVGPRSRSAVGSQAANTRCLRTPRAPPSSSERTVRCTARTTQAKPACERLSRTVIRSTRLASAPRCACCAGNKGHVASLLRWASGRSVQTASESASKAPSLEADQPQRAGDVS